MTKNLTRTIAGTLFGLALAVGCGAPDNRTAEAVYLDETQPLEKRIDDAPVSYTHLRAHETSV